VFRADNILSEHNERTEARRRDRNKKKQQQQQGKSAATKFPQLKRPYLPEIASYQVEKMRHCATKFPAAKMANPIQSSPQLQNCILSWANILHKATLPSRDRLISGRKIAALSHQVPLSFGSTPYKMLTCLICGNAS
jgi:hypothetical protein